MSTDTIPADATTENPQSAVAEPQDQPTAEDLGQTDTSPAISPEVQRFLDDNRPFAERLQEETVAVRFRKHTLGTYRKLTDEQIRRQAELHHANPDFLKSKKKLYNTRNPAFRAVISAMGQAHDHWKSETVEFPERSTRLIRRERLDVFMARHRELEQAVIDAEQHLAEVFREQVVSESRQQLVGLFRESDYPETLDGAFRIDLDFPNVEPPESLMQLNPALFEAEQLRARRRFEEAVRLTEAAFTNELSKLVGAIVDRLTPQEVQSYRYVGPTAMECSQRLQVLLREQADITRQLAALGALGGDVEPQDEDAVRTLQDEFRLREEEQEVLAGQSEIATCEAIERRGRKIKLIWPQGHKPATKTIPKADDAEALQWIGTHGCQHVRTFRENKTFQATSVDNLQAFFDRFRMLNIGSNEELDQLVEQAQAAVQDMTPESLRTTSIEDRLQIQKPLADVAERLDQMVIDRPTRDISFDDE